MSAQKVSPLEIQTGDYLLKFNGRTLVMGILNVTPDSFSDGGLYLNKDKAVKRGIALANEGADIIDVGGESTRPGADPVSLQDELDRVIPVIAELANSIDVPISVDTYKSAVAKEAISAGASIINDISGLRFDKEMAILAAEENVPVVLMHIKGSPRDMQLNPEYDNMLEEVKNYLSESIKIGTDAGIDKEKIIIDPGIGFGKKIEDNFELIKNLGYFRALGHPILVGPSRKSFLWKTLSVSPVDTVEATTAAVTASILYGADIVRVHDVKALSGAIKIADMIANSAGVN